MKKKGGGVGRGKEIWWKGTQGFSFLFSFSDVYSHYRMLIIETENKLKKKEETSPIVPHSVNI